MTLIILAIKTVAIKVGKAIVTKLCSSKFKDIVEKIKTFCKNHKNVIVMVVVALIFGLFVLSVCFNVYWLKRSKTITEAVKDTIQNATQPIVDTLVNTNDDINKTAKEDLEKIKSEISNSDLMNVVEVVSDDGDHKYITLHIDGVDYKYALQTDLTKSQEQTQFISSQMNALSINYENQLKAKDELISNIVSQLNGLQDELTNKIAEMEINKDIAGRVSNAFKMGIGGHYSAKLGDITSNYSAALDFNMLFGVKINASVGLGLSVVDNSPSPMFTTGITYYF